jgi:MOSC domain-containing protein
MPSVARISVAPVKGFLLEHPEEVELTEWGVVENRRFLLTDGEGNRLRSSLTAWPILVRGSYDAASETLRLTFPDGEVEGSALANGTVVNPRFGFGVVPAQVVPGPWTEKLSELAGHPVLLARPERPGDCYEHVVAFHSTASVARLEQEAGAPVDERRFRLLFTIDGVDAHGEDEWIGRRVRIGDAIVRVVVQVDRCATTTRNPETGERDLDTLRLIASYRGLRDGKHADFGVRADVERAGRVRVGDDVVPL